MGWIHEFLRRLGQLAPRGWSPSGSRQADLDLIRDRIEAIRLQLNGQKQPND